jgi:D-glycero-alpha-D-manno-heptose-7-phosphate kinase
MGIAGGFQDYFPSVYGGINWVEQMPKSSEWHHNHLQLHKNLMDLLSTNLVCIELNIKRESEKIINDQIEKSNITNSQTQRALVQQYENALEIKSAGLSGNIDHFLNCIDKSFKLKKDYSPYVTNERILIAEQVLRDLGARGVKLSGAGGGGHMFGFFPEGIPKDIESKLPNFMTRINCNLEKRGIHET